MSSGPELEGFCIDLLAQLSQMLGFSYKLQLVKDARYGSMDASGSWSGMIGEIVRGVSWACRQPVPEVPCECVCARIGPTSPRFYGENPFRFHIYEVVLL